MIGPTNNYKKYLDQEYTPIDVNSLPAFVNMRALYEYAKSKQVPISKLSQEEKELFLISNASI